MGGRDDNNNWTSEVFLFNTDSETCTKAVEGGEITEMEFADN